MISMLFRCAQETAFHLQIAIVVKMTQARGAALRRVAFGFHQGNPLRTLLVRDQTHNARYFVGKIFCELKRLSDFYINCAVSLTVPNVPWCWLSAMDNWAWNHKWLISEDVGQWHTSVMDICQSIRQIKGYYHQTYQQENRTRHRMEPKLQNECRFCKIHKIWRIRLEPTFSQVLRTWLFSFEREIQVLPG